MLFVTKIVPMTHGQDWGLLTRHFAGKDPRSDDIFAKDSLACPNFRSKVSLENHRGFRIYDQKFEMPRTFTS